MVASAQSILQEQNDKLRRLLEVSLVLNENLALKPLLSFIMDAVCEIIDADAASILLYNRTLDELRFVASNSPGVRTEELARIPVPMDGSIAGEILRERKVVMIQDARRDPRIYRSVDEKIDFETRSLLGVPMEIKGDAIGVLEAVNKHSGGWTEHDQNYLSILAAQAAVALQNAQQSEALRKAYEELGKIDTMKNDFIAVASHELRTPLGVILGYASFLQEESQGEANDHATQVLNAALHMRNLIEDMVNLRFLQVGATDDLIRETVPIGKLLSHAYTDAKALSDAKGHQLALDPTNGTLTVNVDRVKIGTVLENVLNNAIKFTPNGGWITITIEPRAREVWVHISDSGVGIPTDQLEKIFDKFHQAEDHMVRKFNGMGLGLAIARGMAEAHGGRLWAESQGTGMGSTFTLALPHA
jgi:signal transduction histidine kinase